MSRQVIPSPEACLKVTNPPVLHAWQDKPATGIGEIDRKRLAVSWENRRRS